MTSTVIQTAVVSDERSSAFAPGGWLSTGKEFVKDVKVANPWRFEPLAATAVVLDSAHGAS
jgi:hypothetical protein